MKFFIFMVSDIIVVTSGFNPVGLNQSEQLRI